MRIILDFDYTLFDTEAFRVAVIEKFDSLGISDAQYRQTEHTLLHDDGHGLYTFTNHMETLSQEVDIPSTTLMETAESILSDMTPFVFPDAFTFLQTVKEEKHILTYGRDTWQHMKVTNSGVADLVGDVVPTNGKLKDEVMVELLSDDDMIFIDDRGSAIDTVKAAFPEIRCIRLHRKGTPYYDEECTSADDEITRLSPNILE